MHEQTSERQRDTAAFWNRFARVYDLMTASGEVGLDEAAAYIATHLTKHDVVLDAACGTGAFTLRLAPHVGFVAGCDLARNMVEQATRRSTRLGLSNVAFGTGDICALDFADDTFDAACAGNVLHLLPDPLTALSELCRVVRPHGVVALPTYVNAEDHDKRFLRLIELAGFQAAHEWDEAGYLAFLEEAGADVVDWRHFSAKQPLCVAIVRV